MAATLGGFLKTILITIFSLLAINAHAGILTCVSVENLTGLPVIEGVRFNPDSGYISFNLMSETSGGDAVAVRAYLAKVSKTVFEKQIDELTSITVYSLGDALFDVEYSEISSDGDYTFQSKVRCQ